MSYPYSRKEEHDHTILEYGLPTHDNAMLLQLRTEHTGVYHQTLMS